MDVDMQRGAKQPELLSGWRAELTRQERQLYDALARFKGSYVASEYLIASIAPNSCAVSPIGSPVKRLRAKLRALGRPEEVRLSSGFGYGLFDKP